MRKSRLPRRRWRRRICTRHRDPEAGRGRPEGACEQRTSDELFDLHSLHLSLLSASFTPLGAQMRYAHHIGAATVESQPEANLKTRARSVSRTRPPRSRR
ncbi:hypothetical protein A5758_23260 [Mycobacterium sp. 852014-50255_SCH5639931]|nr:hypothetical protein A5758_23260 [Mycobacterium sp. 852014-50255_SCH5639931]